jgi:hypothetical protein
MSPEVSYPRGKLRPDVYSRRRTEPQGMGGALNFISKNIVGLTAALVVARDLLAGPGRYYLDVVGLSYAWFIPDAMMIVAAAVAFISGRSTKNAVVLMSIFLYFLFETIYGSFTVRSVEATISGVKLAVPLFFGIVVGRGVLAYFENILVSLISFAVICLAIIYNTANEFIWTDYALIVGDIQKSAAASRWFEGEARIAGLQADSTMAGFACLITAYFAAQRLSFFYRVILLAVAGYCINVTTSRTALVSLIVWVLYDVSIFVMRRGVGLSYSQCVKFLYVIVSYSIIYVQVIAVIAFNNIHMDIIPSYLFSYYDRATFTWVDPFRTMAEEFFPHGYLFGFGVGMVGPPVNFANLPFVFLSYTDNFALATYLMLGVPGLIYLLHLIWRHGQVSQSKGALVLAAVLMYYGGTIEGFSNATYCMLVGALLSPLYRWEPERAFGERRVALSKVRTAPVAAAPQSVA